MIINYRLRVLNAFVTPSMKIQEGSFRPYMFAPKLFIYLLKKCLIQSKFLKKYRKVNNRIYDRINRIYLITSRVK